MHRWLGTLAVTALLALSGAGLAQTYNWSEGDIQIMGAHPDLMPEDDGRVHSSGDYYSQIVLRGEDASQVEELGFSFGAGPPSPQHYPGFTGLWDFRIDSTPEDGWFFPLTSSDTPDGEYKFAIHAYGSAGDQSSEIARFWGGAVVENEAGDIVGPWPWVLPGETSSTTNPHDVAGVTIEFAEEASARLWVNGEEVNLSEWTPPPRDDDEVPRHTVDSERAVLGSGYKWEGSVERGTVLRVQAVDEADNQVTKGLLVGVGVDAPAIEVRFPDQLPELSTGSGTDVDVTVANIGMRAANVSLTLEAPDGLSGELDPADLTLAPGQTRETTLNLTVDDASVNLTGQAIGVDASYEAGGQLVSTAFESPLDAGMAGEAGVLQAGDTEEGGPGEEDEDGVPGPGAGLVLLAVAIVAAHARRRGPG